MKLRIAAALAALLIGTSVQARDTIVLIPLADVIDEGESTGKLDGSVRFYLDGQRAPAVLDRFGEAVSNRKTNAANKSDAEACRWVVLSALVALQEEAQSRGANAVTDIISWYKRKTYRDPAKVECHAGALMAGITLKGNYAKVAAK